MRLNWSDGSRITTFPTPHRQTAETSKTLLRTTGMTMSSSHTTSGTPTSSAAISTLVERRSRKAPRRTRTACSARSKARGRRLSLRLLIRTTTFRTGFLTGEFDHSLELSRSYTDITQLDRVAAQVLPRLSWRSQPISTHSRLPPFNCPLKLPISGEQGRRDFQLPRRLDLPVLV